MDDAVVGAGGFVDEDLNGILLVSISMRVTVLASC